MAGDNACEPTPFHLKFGCVGVEPQTPQTCPVDSLIIIIIIISSYDSANVPYSASESSTTHKYVGHDQSWESESMHDKSASEAKSSKSVKPQGLFPSVSTPWLQRLVSVTPWDLKGAARENTNQTEGARGSYATGHIPFAQTGGVSAQINELFMHFWHTYSPR